jgi:chromatin remodeling complex protein RSC6
MLIYLRYQGVQILSDPGDKLLGEPTNFICPPPMPDQAVRKARAAKSPRRTALGNDAGEASKRPAAKKFLRKPGSKLLKPSTELAAVIGSDPLTRAEAVTKLWSYISQHELQNQEDKREIIADEKSATVSGKSKITPFEMDSILD